MKLPDASGSCDIKPQFEIRIHCGHKLLGAMQYYGDASQAHLFAEACGRELASLIKRKAEHEANDFLPPA